MGLFWIALIFLWSILLGLVILMWFTWRSPKGREDFCAPIMAPRGFRYLDGAEDSGGIYDPPECDVLMLEGNAAAVSPGVVFVLGNPGCAPCYVTFARCLQEALAGLLAGQKPSVYIVGLANFASRREYLGPALTALQEKERVARALARIGARGHSSLLLVAHSMTSSFLLDYSVEAIRHGTGCLAGKKVPVILLVQPFLEFDFWSAQSFLKLLFSCTGSLFRWLADFFVGLPLDSRRDVLKGIMHPETDEELEIYVKTVGSHRQHIPAVTHLAANTFQFMERDRETSGFHVMHEFLSEEKRPHLAVFYAKQGDTYASLKHMLRLGAMFSRATGPSADIGSLGVVDHNFAQFHQQSKRVAETIAPHLQQAWKRSPDCGPLPAASD